MEGPIKSYTNKEQLLICLVVNSEILTHRQKKVNKMCKLIKKTVQFQIKITSFCKNDF